MPQQREITAKLLDICEPVITGAGYELVDILFRREQHGWVMRVFIDGVGGISFADCERVSRELSPVLDVADPVPQAYSLELSSPGLDRPLRTQEHFCSGIGSVAKVVLGQGLDGRRNFKGELVAVEPEIVVIDVEGQQFRLPISDIESARIVPKWDEVLKQG